MTSVKQKVRKSQAIAADILESESVAQINDADKPLRSRDEVLDVPITITSVRARPSDYRDGSYAVVGYTSEAIGDGQFKAPRSLSNYLLKTVRYRQPPFAGIVRKTIWNGHDQYNWEWSK